MHLTPNDVQFILNLTEAGQYRGADVDYVAGLRASLRAYAAQQQQAERDRAIVDLVEQPEVVAGARKRLGLEPANAVGLPTDVPVADTSAEPAPPSAGEDTRPCAEESLEP